MLNKSSQYLLENGYNQVSSKIFLKFDLKNRLKELNQICFLQSDFQLSIYIKIKNFKKI